MKEARYIEETCVVEEGQDGSSEDSPLLLILMCFLICFVVFFGAGFSVLVVLFFCCGYFCHGTSGRFVVVVVMVFPWYYFAVEHVCPFKATIMEVDVPFCCCCFCFFCGCV